MYIYVFVYRGEFNDPWIGKKDYQKHSFCGRPDTKLWIKLLRFYPYWVRFAQCIRRFYDTSKISHLINAGKYISCIATSVVATCDEVLNTDQDDDEQPYPSLHEARLYLALTSTFYAFMWDIIKDWGLFHFDCKYKLLRKELRFKPGYYYLVMITNFIFRIAWGVYLFPKSFRVPIDMHYWALGLGAIEITRRCIWNIFRLENEHINNCGEFRVVRDIPPLLTPTSPDIIQQQQADDDDISSQGSEGGLQETKYDPKLT